MQHRCGPLGGDDCILDGLNDLVDAVLFTERLDIQDAGVLHHLEGNGGLSILVVIIVPQRDDVNNHVGAAEDHIDTLLGVHDLDRSGHRILSVDLPTHKLIELFQFRQFAHC
ncbi:hypothetical protein [uncultured Duncaniella sp.]|uniref:hypothetical protein n=1 Tax=uncultured Duncaniella sp. TaxID=2768039 RepID=UPI002631C8A1|nr:hypothetical protein [uncultured Duncaniella sp.]